MGVKAGREMTGHTMSAPRLVLPGVVATPGTNIAEGLSKLTGHMTDLRWD